MSPLRPSEARAVYDRIGAWQDTQSFYEDPALDALVRHGAFEDARHIFEIGCGTGRLARELLENVCPPDTEYVGVDVSPRMVDLTREQLVAFSERVHVSRSDGTFSFDVSPGSQDRVVATYVLDLLPISDIRALLEEAHRVLRASGRLCLAGLTWGSRGVARLVSGLWAIVHSVKPALVGGCRPIEMGAYLRDRWTVSHREIVQSWGVPSEVVVARPA